MRFILSLSRSVRTFRSTPHYFNFSTNREQQVLSSDFCSFVQSNICALVPGPKWTILISLCYGDTQLCEVPSRSDLLLSSLFDGVRDGGDSMLPAIFHGRVFTTVPSFDRFLLYVVDVQLRSDQNRTNQMGTLGNPNGDMGMGCC